MWGYDVYSKAASKILRHRNIYASDYSVNCHVFENEMQIALLSKKSYMRRGRRPIIDWRDQSELLDWIENGCSRKPRFQILWRYEKDLVTGKQQSGIITHIRAIQGHSNGERELSDPAHVAGNSHPDTGRHVVTTDHTNFLWHGTNRSAIDGILERGLRPGGLALSGG